MATIRTWESAAEERTAAAAELRRIVGTLSGCLAVEDEAEALSAQLDRLEAADAVLAQRGEDPREQIRAMARDAVAAMPLADICQDQELVGVFTAEIVREILRAADERRTADRRKKQADGIAAARANGVRFGRQTTPLPPNFDEARIAWRSGGCTLRDAARLCGMSRTTFYRAVLKAEGDPTADPPDHASVRHRTEAVRTNAV